jgi:hypothetical protein
MKSKSRAMKEVLHSKAEHSEMTAKQGYSRMWTRMLFLDNSERGGAPQPRLASAQPGVKQALPTRAHELLSACAVLSAGRAAWPAFNHSAWKARFVV